MVCRNPSARRPGGLASSTAPVLIALILLVGVPPSVPANPLPESLVFVHVQEVDPLFCASCPITSCPEIVQHTDLSGLLEFDLFFAPFAFGPDETISSFSGTLQWPAAWAFVGGQTCLPGLGTIEPSGNQATINVTWPECPPIGGELLLVARLVLNVSGHGALTGAGLPVTIEIGCPPATYMTETYVVGGEAGVECAFCFQPCDLSSPCRPVPDPTVLDLEVQTGSTAEAAIHVNIHGGPLGWPC